MRHELTGQVRRTFGPGRAEPGDVWGAATTEPPPDGSMDAPECAWCPICRAARRIAGIRPGPEAGRSLRRSRRGGRGRPGRAVSVRLDPVHAPGRTRTRPIRPSRRPRRTGRGQAGANRTHAAAGAPHETESRIMSLAIGVDVGGTKVAAGVVDEHGQHHREAEAGHAGREPAADRADVIVEVVTRAARAGTTSTAVGHRRGRLRRRDPVGGPVRAQPGLAGRAGARSRSRTGSAARSWSRTTRTRRPGPRSGSAPRRDHDHVMLIAVGTGIGAGLVLNGQLYRGRWGIAGEPGHYRVVPTAGCAAAATGAAGSSTRAATPWSPRPASFARRSPGAAVRLLQLGGGSVEGIAGPVVTEAAPRKATPRRCAASRSWAHWLGDGLADLAAILDPGCFVIGGGVSEAGDLLLGPARAAFANGLTGGSVPAARRDQDRRARSRRRPDRRR